MISSVIFRDTIFTLRKEKVLKPGKGHLILDKNTIKGHVSEVQKNPSKSAFFDTSCIASERIRLLQEHIN